MITSCVGTILNAGSRVSIPHSVCSHVPGFPGSFIAALEFMALSRKELGKCLKDYKQAGGSWG